MKTVNLPNTRSGAAQLAELLTTMNQEGGFAMSVLTDQDGLPIAAATRPGEDPELEAAMVALVQKTAVQAWQQLGMAQADEIVLHDANGQRLVCRPFNANGHEMILAVRLHGRSLSYRRLTTRAISQIRSVWQ